MRQKIYTAFVAILCAITLIIVWFDTAQSQTAPDKATYRIVGGDYVIRILEAKCGPTEARNWKQYLAMPENRKLNTPNRAFTTARGDVGWYIYPNELITLPTNKCNRATNLLVPATAQVVTTNPSFTLGDVDKLLEARLANISGAHVPWWIWVLLAVLGALVIYLLSHWSRHNEWERREMEARQREDAARDRTEEYSFFAHNAQQQTIGVLADQLNEAQRRERVLFDNNRQMFETLVMLRVNPQPTAEDEVTRAMRGMSFGDNNIVCLTLGNNSPATQTATATTPQREEAFAGR